MTPDQFQQLLAVLMKIAEKPSTITGMQDWPMLMVLFSMFGALLLVLAGGGLGYILSRMETDRKENREDHALIWQSQKDCQEDCCPKGIAAQREASRSATKP